MSKPFTFCVGGDFQNLKSGLLQKTVPGKIENILLGSSKINKLENDLGKGVKVVSRKN